MSPAEPLGQGGMNRDSAWFDEFIASGFRVAVHGPRIDKDGNWINQIT